ncbi:LRRNT_2 domain-containing protein [Psidium guajava]|nr:LRRNT_2 domain-containing protein [Psidium guajava]
MHPPTLATGPPSSLPLTLECATLAAVSAPSRTLSLLLYRVIPSTPHLLASQALEHRGSRNFNLDSWPFREPDLSSSNALAVHDVIRILCYSVSV